MRFRIEIECLNAAFGDEPAAEIVAILRAAMTRIEWRGMEPGERFPLFDANGNTVGVMELSEAA